MSWYYNNDWKKHCDCDCRRHKRCSICDCFFGFFNCFGCRRHSCHDRCCCKKDHRLRCDRWNKCIY
ncbi:MAG: hypothetical protein GX304_06065 [Clostridiales bacterium]|nr:hypothetical protein [Clostridiales bacterium]